MNPNLEPAPAADPVRLVFLPRGDGPTTWWICAGGGVVDRGVFVEEAADTQPGLRTIAVVPGEDVLCRWLELPGGRDAQAAAAATFLLEDRLAQSRERLHVALGAAEPDGQRLAVVVDAGRMHAWTDRLIRLGLTVEFMTPDCLLVPEPPDGETAAVALGEVRAVRGPRLAMTCDAELLPVVVSDRAYVTLDAPAAVEGALARGASRPLPDLRQGGFASKTVRPGGRTGLVVALAAALAASVVAVPLVQAGRNELAARAAQAEVETLAGPGAGDDAAPAVDRLRGELRRTRAAERFPSSAAAVFAAMERIEGMELQSLLYDDEGTFHLTVAHANYSDVEALRSALAGAGLSVKENSAATDQGLIVSDLVLRPSR